MKGSTLAKKNQRSRVLTRRHKIGRSPRQWVEGKPAREWATAEAPVFAIGYFRPFVFRI